MADYNSRQAEVLPPVKVTVRWLIDHVPYKLWLAALGIVVSAISLGVAGGVNACRSDVSQAFFNISERCGGDPNRVSELETEISSLKKENSGLKAENSGLKAENGGLKAENGGLKAEKSDFEESQLKLSDKVQKLELERGKLVEHANRKLTVRSTYPCNKGAAKDNDTSCHYKAEQRCNDNQMLLDSIGTVTCQPDGSPNCVMQSYTCKPKALF